MMEEAYMPPTTPCARPAIARKFSHGQRFNPFVRGRCRCNVCSEEQSFENPHGFERVRYVPMNAEHQHLKDSEDGPTCSEVLTRAAQLFNVGRVHFYFCLSVSKQK